MSHVGLQTDSPRSHHILKICVNLIVNFCLCFNPETFPLVRYGDNEDGFTYSLKSNFDYNTWYWLREYLSYTFYMPLGFPFGKTYYHYFYVSRGKWDHFLSDPSTILEKMCWATSTNFSSLLCHWHTKFEC